MIAGKYGCHKWYHKSIAMINYKSFKIDKNRLQKFTYNGLNFYEIQVPIHFSEIQIEGESMYRLDKFSLLSNQDAMVDEAGPD